jgi:uncharacterized protein (UPF0218 family)/phosphopantetheine adenylyltransferase
MSSNQRFECCLIGGTFDRLHAGHELLFTTAFSMAHRVEIYVLNQIDAEKKSPHILDFEQRIEDIENWVREHGYTNFLVSELGDRHGPAPTHPRADCIISTPETQFECEKINEVRAENNLPELEIIVVAQLPSVGGGIISSTRIRNGQIDKHGFPWIHDIWRTSTLMMTEEVGNMLKQPFGVLFEGSELEPSIAMGNIFMEYDFSVSLLITVGDVTTKTALDMDVVPDIALIDGKTKRIELSDSHQINIHHFEQNIMATNPAGQLTPDLLNAIELCFQSEEHSVIVVDGEEDLAPLFVHLCAPLGTVVLYGQPNKGIVAQITTLASKKRCSDILGLFEVLD